MKNKRSQLMSMKPGTACHRLSSIEAQFASGLAGLLRRSIKGTARRAQPPRRAVSVLVALSGGPDSVALLHLTCAVAETMRLRVSAAHVNYHLRGSESDQDERFCVALCKRLGVKLYVRRVSLGWNREGNLQDQARKVRYDFFVQLCDKYRIDYIATGHNKSDHVETILMNLCRGAGTFGLSGIDRQTGRVIRPLLAFGRGDIVRYLKGSKAAFRVDRSNLARKYTRNKVRRQLLPALERTFGAAVLDNISRSGMVLSEQEAFLRGEADRLLRRDAAMTPGGKVVVDLKRFRRYPTLLKRLVVALCFGKLAGSIREFDFAVTERVLSMLDTGSGIVDLKENVSAEIAGDNMYIYGRRQRPSTRRLIDEGQTELKAYAMTLAAEAMPARRLQQIDIRSGRNRTVYLDRGKLDGLLSVRTFKPGDRFLPLGMRQPKKLSDFFVDRKIERPLRDEIPLLLSGRNIVWVVGYEIADTVKVTETTEEILKLEVRPYRSI